MRTLLWRHNERDGVFNHRRLDCLLNRFLKCRSNKTSKLRVTGLCDGNSQVTGEFPAQKFPFDDVIMQTSNRVNAGKDLSTFILTLQVTIILMIASYLNTAPYNNINIKGQESFEILMICTGVLIINLRRSSDYHRFVMRTPFPVKWRHFG